MDFKNTVLSHGVEWRVEKTPVAYPDALAEMDSYVAALHEGTARERVWLLEHPPLYTAGTSARSDDLLMPDRFPVFRAGRGGQYTYHGPGQRVAYVMLDLKKRGGDLRLYIENLERWIIAVLAGFDIKGVIRQGRVGVWVESPDGQENKIAAIGVRVRHWISFHGIAINVSPNLDHFSGIVPCGLSHYGVTSLKALGSDASTADVDAALMRLFPHIFSL